MTDTLDGCSIEGYSAVHAMLALAGCGFITGWALDVGVELKDGLLLDHDPGHPSVRYGEQEKQSHDRTRAKVEELNAERKDKEYTSGENVDWPFESHQTTLTFHYSFQHQGLSLHPKGRRIHIHVAIFHHLPHLLVQLAVAAHAFHHLSRAIPLTDEFADVLFPDA